MAFIDCVSSNHKQISTPHNICFLQKLFLVINLFIQLQLRHGRCHKHPLKIIQLKSLTNGLLIMILLLHDRLVSSLKKEEHSLGNSLLLWIPSKQDLFHPNVMSLLPKYYLLPPSISIAHAYFTQPLYKVYPVCMTVDQFFAFQGPADCTRRRLCSFRNPKRSCIFQKCQALIFLTLASYQSSACGINAI